MEHPVLLGRRTRPRVAGTGAEMTCWYESLQQVDAQDMGAVWVAGAENKEGCALWRGRPECERQ